MVLIAVPSPVRYQYSVPISCGMYVTYEGQRVAEEHESWCMVGELVGEALYVGVYFIVYGSYFERLFIDFVWRA
jgi:hypothetical protein